VGYNEYSYFNRVFKKHMGMSPREYRNYVETQEGCR
jgi:YesN/AraC family two-component response regulator